MIDAIFGFLRNPPAPQRTPRRRALPARAQDPHTFSRELDVSTERLSSDVARPTQESEMRVVTCVAQCQ